MKKSLWIVFHCCVFALFGCTSEMLDPGAVSEAFLLACKNYDTHVVNNLSVYTEDLVVWDILEYDYIEEVDKQLQTNVYEKLYEFSYQIEDVEVLDKQAYVTVVFYVYDMERVVKNSIATIEAYDLLEEEKTQDELIVEILTAVYEDILEVETQKEVQVTLELALQSSSWKVMNAEDVFMILLEPIYQIYLELQEI